MTNKTSVKVESTITIKLTKDDVLLLKEIKGITEERTCSKAVISGLNMLTGVMDELRAAQLQINELEKEKEIGMKMRELLELLQK